MVAGALPRARGCPHAAKDGTYARLPLLGSKLGITIMSSGKPGGFPYRVPYCAVPAARARPNAQKRIGKDLTMATARYRRVHLLGGIECYVHSRFSWGESHV